MIPRPLAITDPELVFSTDVGGGFNLRAMMASTQFNTPFLTIFKVKTPEGKFIVPGFFSSVPLSDGYVVKSGTPFGDGTTFLFVLDGENSRKFPWSEKAPNRAFFTFDGSCLYVGAGKDGAAFAFTDDLFVDSNRCDTFGTEKFFPDGSTLISLEIYSFY